MLLDFLFIVVAVLSLVDIDVDDVILFDVADDVMLFSVVDDVILFDVVEMLLLVLFVAKIQ